MGPFDLARLGLLFALCSVAVGCTCDKRTPPGGPADRSQGAIPLLRARHVAPGAIVVDGTLGEAAWHEAAGTGDFVLPNDGMAQPGSRVNAQARLLWSDRALYVAFVVHDGHPSTPFSRDAVDPHIWERATGVELMVQPGDPGDNRHYYEIQVDTAGAVWDTRFDDYNQPITAGPRGRRFGHQEWSAHLERAVEVDPDGKHYAIEMALPWSALASDHTAVPPHRGDIWRINMYSFRDGQREAMAWSPLLGQGNFHRASRFGRVLFGP